MNEIATQGAAFLGLFGLPALVAAAVATLVARFFGSAISEKMKAAIKAEYDQKLENLKASLKATSDNELERQKHELAVQAMQHNVRYSRLHEMRATVIGDAYAALSETYDALRAYTASFEPTGGPSKDERLGAMSAALKKFRESFVSKKVFLPEKIARQLDEIHGQMFITGNAFFWGVHFPPPDVGQTQKWLEITERVDGPIKIALEDLENELRRLMGDEEL